MHYLLYDIGVAVIAATVFGLLAHWLRQPILLGYLIAGALVGPELGFGFVHAGESIEIISEMGLILLLFIIGLELNIKEVLAAGRQLLVAGFGQFLICLALGVGVFWLCGLGLSGKHADGLYLAIMCALSSTAIVVKLLYDKGELDTLPGRLTLGVLVIQDVYAILVLALQPNFANPSLMPILKALAGTAALLLWGFFFSRYALKRIFASIAKNPEMVLAVSVGWCAAVAAAAGALGLSKEMGALVAGLSIAAFPYSVHVTAKTLPLRDFFLTLFFVSLGMKITAPNWGMVAPVLGIVAFVFVSRFASVYPLVVMTGAGRRAGFVTSINLAQISEFSLVIASLGVAYGHIGKGTVAITIYAMAVMAVLSSYAIRYSHSLYQVFERLTGARNPTATDDAETAASHGPEIVLLGYHRGARALVEALERRDAALLKRTMVIDFNPVSLEEARERGLVALFGDIGSIEVLRHAHIGHAKYIISTIPDLLLKGVDNAELVEMAVAIAPHAMIIATADDAQHERELRAKGAGAVARVYEMAADALAEAVTDTQRARRRTDAVAPSILVA
ncbi:MAG: sodium/hydrogen exchanger [Phycisphaerales bacterium]|nr:sodium/hydrogen exchanger [Phycisphaerales bacterium]